ncbi:VOC family protein [Pedobacter sp. JCM 36344]|uniref:VOC family protein n=1 Tax=Pedobacter sp. JCM 36344 TaxID=3374280 RepID=UPI00397861E5
MAKKIFINLPVADLQKAMTFYTAIGFTNNPMFTDETAACMTLTEEIYVMLLTHPKFKEFTKKEIGNTIKMASVINSLSVDSNEEVNTMIERAIVAGGTEPNEAKDFGFMQQRSFEDLDGHLWEVLYMDLSKFPQQ